MELGPQTKFVGFFSVAIGTPSKPLWGITLFVCLRVLLSHRPPPSSRYPLVADILPPKPPLSLAGSPSHNKTPN